MALFDPERERIVIRVVYDGPGHAGKTTNLARLCRAFAAWRRSDMVSPNTLGERTQYFDWLEVEGGLLASYPIRAQLLTVPGQRELTVRRRFVIEHADVVVFVADSRPEALAESKAFYAELCEQLAGFPEPIPIVVQANKQDLPGAMKPPAFAKALSQGTRAPDQVVGSVASTDKGVKQTLTVALKLGSDQLRKRLGGQKVHALAGVVGDAAGTYAALEHHEAELARARLGERLEPPRPQASLPSTHIWPPVTGRALLGELEQVELRRHATSDDEVLLASAAWRLSTGRDRCYDGDDAGLLAMWQLTRRKVALAGWLPEPSVVALQPDPAGTGMWLWTLEPALPRLADALRSSATPERRRAALNHYAEILTGALALAETRSLVVDLDPSSYALQADEGDRERVRYVGPTLAAGHALEGLVARVFATLEQHAGDAIALADFIETLLLGLRRVPLDWDRRAALQGEFVAAAPRDAGAERVRDAIVITLSKPARE